MSPKDFYAEDLAYIHHVGFPDMIEGAAPALLDEFRRRGWNDGLVVDLGCGGGAWSRRLTDAGFQAWGCDISPSMVAIARATAPHAEFEVASLFETSIPSCRAVTALGEGFNYGMAGADPAACLAVPFTRIAQALPLGGLFAFDLVVQPGADARQESALPMSYRRWKSAEDWAVLMAVEENIELRSLTRDVVIFREVEGAYRRSEERHVIGIPTVGEVLGQLDAAGFTAESSDHYGAFQVMPRRATFMATRRAGSST
ncbi:MAG: methyltransferase domain-containing protein [Planctomycetota bacterium]|jgi:SAM-dependent methyltransferase